MEQLPKKRELRYIEGKLVQVFVEPEEQLLEFTASEKAIIDQVKENITLLQVPEYIPDELKAKVQALIVRHCNEVFESAVKDWQKMPIRSSDGLLNRYQALLEISYLVAHTFHPAKDPDIITENTFAVTRDGVTVANVGNCTGCVIRTESVYLGFHVLGFGQVGVSDVPITEEKKAEVAQDVADMVGLLDSPPLEIMVHASTMEKGYGSIDTGHAYVEAQLRSELQKRFPDAFKTQDDVPIKKLAVTDFGLHKEK